MTPKASATDVLQDALVAAVLEAVSAWKAASGGLPNVLARDLSAVHPNTSFADLPREVQAALREATRAAFTRLLKAGYAVGPTATTPPLRTPPSGPGGLRPGGPRGPRPGGGPQRPRGPGKPPAVEIKRPPRGPGKPPRP
jgi:hypothetical protein